MSDTSDFEERSRGPADNTVAQIAEVIAAQREIATHLERFILFCREKAEQGDPAFMCYLPGLLCDLDPAEAMRWDEVAGLRGRTFWRSKRQFPPRVVAIRLAARDKFLIAAESGYPFAMERSGDLVLAAGDEIGAMRWYRLAAEEGWASAMFSLHELLWTTDRQKALEWLQRSAESGCTSAMLAVANLLAKVNWTESQSWLEKARKLGDPLVDKVNDELTRAREVTQN